MQNTSYDLLTIAEVARLLRVDHTTVRRWIKQGTLEAVPLPHKNERQVYRVKRAAIDAIYNSVPQRHEVHA